MAEQATSFVQEGVDRLHAARERIDEELQRVQRELQARRKRLERRIDSGRKNIERQTRKQVQQLRSEVSRSPLVKRFEELRVETTRAVEGVLGDLLGAFQIASKADVDKIDRKLSKISKKLKELERARGSNGQQPHSHA